MALYGGLLLAVLLPLFVSLGLWQWNKAERKTAIQAELDLRSQQPAIAMPGSGIDVESLRHRRVRLQGQRDGCGVRDSGPRQHHCRDDAEPVAWK